MKKLIATTLAVTMLVTPLVGSACFADEVNEPRTSNAQNEKRSEEEFKLKKDEYPKIKKILAGVAAGTIALTGVTAATLKKFEDKLPENLKAKLPLLFTKETQGDNESEKALEDFKEGEDVETFIEGSNIAKDEAVEPTGVENGNGFTHDKIIRPLTTNSTTSAITNITTESVKEGKDETVEPTGVENRNGFTHDEIIRPLTTNNTNPAIVGNITNNTTDTNNTNRVSGIENSVSNWIPGLVSNTTSAIANLLAAIAFQKIKNDFEIKAGPVAGPEAGSVGMFVGTVGTGLGLVLGQKVKAGVGATATATAGAIAAASGAIAARAKAVAAREEAAAVEVAAGAGAVAAVAGAGILATASLGMTILMATVIAAAEKILS